MLAKKMLMGGAGNGVPITSPNHPNLVGFWTMDNISGATLFDETPNNNDGTITGAVFDSGGIIDGALLFDGINDEVNIPHSSSLNVGGLGNDYSAALWFRTTTSSDLNMTSKFGPAAPASNSEMPFLISIGQGAPGRVRVAYRGDDTVFRTINSVNSYNNDVWHFVSISRDQSTFKFTLRIDDTEDILGPADVTASMANNTIITLGYLNNNGSKILYYPGKLDQYRIFNKAISASEHAELYNSGAGA